MNFLMYFFFVHNIIVNSGFHIFFVVVLQAAEPAPDSENSSGI